MILERVQGFDTEIVRYYVPGVMPNFGNFVSTVQLEQGGLYSLAIVDGPGDGLDLPDEDVGTSTIISALLFNDFQWLPYYAHVRVSSHLCRQ